jgi:REP element-mobilizing transposase RayT
MSTTITPLLPGHWYHLYNRGINGETIYHTEANYQYFLDLLAKYVFLTAKVYAYCLMKNHFHLLVSIHDDTKRKPHLYFSDMFNSYTQGLNKHLGRTGSLFERPFRRKVISSEKQRVQVTLYIHNNPRHHGIMNDIAKYQYSSYRAVMSSAPTKVEREEVLSWFGGRDSFVAYHGASRDDISDDLTLE